MRRIILFSLTASLVGFGFGRYSTRGERDEFRDGFEKLESSQKKLKDDLAAFGSVDLVEINRIEDAGERADRLSELVGELFMVLLNHALLPAGAGSVGSITYDLRIFDDGQRIGKTSGTGDLSIFNTQVPSEAFIIRASPEEFFQIYALPDGQNLIGNYYEVTALEEPKLLGRTRLLRN